MKVPSPPHLASARGRRRIHVGRSPAHLNKGLTLRNISIAVMALSLALLAGPAVGVAEAATVRYPDTDIVALKTTGGFVGGSGFAASAVPQG